MLKTYLLAVVDYIKSLFKPVHSRYVATYGREYVKYYDTEGSLREYYHYPTTLPLPAGQLLKLNPSKFTNLQRLEAKADCYNLKPAKIHFRVVSSAPYSVKTRTYGQVDKKPNFNRDNAAAKLLNNKHDPLKQRARK